MPLIAKETKTMDFTPLDEGLYQGTCYAIIDLGIQHSDKFDKDGHKVRLIWEIPEELIEIDGEMKPRAISKEYTLSLSDKANLRKDLQSWRGRAFTEAELAGFDLHNVLGKSCQLQIIHQNNSMGEISARVNAIMPLPKGVKLSPPTNPLIFFDLEEAGWQDKLQKLPKKVQEKIMSSVTYKELMKNGGASGPNYEVQDKEDDLPF